ncbi:MAG: response regulator [Thermoguttaceae bacterium]|jgi:CheY-like chemotaxis protein|nr:response regulator [Thermoguttaceae bacterium]
MARDTRTRTILMVDDDADDCTLVRDALGEIGVVHDLRFAGDGEELFDYLERRGRFAAGNMAPRPDLILLDLQMPRKNGRESLKQLKSEPAWRRIPVVVLTTSTAADDINYAYEMGVNSYVTKPTTFRTLVEAVRLMTTYWFELVEPPQND